MGENANLCWNNNDVNSNVIHPNVHRSRRTIILQKNTNGCSSIASEWVHGYAYENQNIVVPLFAHSQWRKLIHKQSDSNRSSRTGTAKPSHRKKTEWSQFIRNNSPIGHDDIQMNKTKAANLPALTWSCWPCIGWSPCIEPLTPCSSSHFYLDIWQQESAGKDQHHWNSR